MNILYMALKHVICRFRICNYFRETFRFRDFMNTLRNFAKPVFTHIFAKFKYFAKQFDIFDSHSRDIAESFAKISHKVAKSKYFSIF